LWYAFFVVGGLWFWILAAIEIAFLSFFVQDENPLASFVSVAIFVLLIHLFGNAGFFSYITENPWDVVRWVVLYSIIGFGWAVAKYFYVAKRVSNKISGIKEAFAKEAEYEMSRWSGNNKGKTPVREHVWKYYLNDSLGYDDQAKLDFSHQGAQIIFWMAYWPISMFWTFFTDILKNFGTWCYETFLIQIFKKIHEYTIGSATRLAPEDVITPGNPPKAP